MGKRGKRVWWLRLQTWAVGKCFSFGHLTWDQKMRRGVTRREECWVRFPESGEREREREYKTFLGSIEKSLISSKLTMWFSAENFIAWIHKLGRTLPLVYALWRCFPVFSVRPFYLLPSTLSCRKLFLILLAGPCLSWNSCRIRVAMKYQCMCPSPYESVNPLRAGLH